MDEDEEENRARGEKRGRRVREEDDGLSDRTERKKSKAGERIYRVSKGKRQGWRREISKETGRK